MDEFQQRYLKHQKKKARVLAEIIDERHSERKFGSLSVDVAPILDALDKVPSSCDRKAVRPTVIQTRDEKNILAGLLVGGVGWAHRADKIILLFADQIAYKAGDEIKFMPYLDAGVMVQQALLTATSLGYSACFINPNIRDEHRFAFERLFGDKLFCGAIAVGNNYEREQTFGTDT